jgi:hypothetical protein
MIGGLNPEVSGNHRLIARQSNSQNSGIAAV